MRGAALVCLLGLGGWAAEGEELFEKRIRPVLAERCYGCHSTKMREPKANLRLDSREGLLRGGDSGPAIVPGKPDESRLLQAISYTGLTLRMPPSGKLPDSVIADFRQWIALGAPDPRVETSGSTPRKPAGIDVATGRRFWAFQPLAAPVPPAVKNAAWPKQPMDHFLLAKLEEKGFQPAKPAADAAWLRRVTFDLTGLPPTPAELTAGGSRQQIVDRLLASPHYAERWARHFLDLVRFAETNGHEYDNNKLDAWQYRDYLIRAFNEDVPYNRLVEEHIAGDLLPAQRISRDGSKLESPLGTGFYWFGEVLNSATDSLKSRADNVDNQIDVAAKAFLGLTVACARCHDHKFDPIPTADYYGLAGVMHSTGMREAVVDSPAWAAAIHRAHFAIGAVVRKPGKIKIAPRADDIVFENFQNFDAWQASGEAFQAGPNNGTADSAGRGANELVGSLTSKKFRMPRRYVHIRMAGTKGEKSLIEREPLRVTLVADDYKSTHWLGTGKREFEWITFRMTLPYQRLCYFEIVDRSRTGNIAVDAIVFSDEKEPPQTEVLEKADWREPSPVADLPPSNWGLIAWDEAPQNVKLHIRGSHQNLGAEVPRHFLQVLSKPDYDPRPAGSGRLELAKWMTSDAAPLLARVFVNRVWKHHFGQGLVRSADNFGLMGDRPTNAELLDYLAGRLINSGWSLKALHREMVLSEAYAMSSQASPDAAKADPRNDLLHHFPVRRLEAEEIRDAMLSISGALQPGLYGPSVVPHISKYQDGRGKPASGPLDGDGRRSIYIQVRRNFLTPLFLAFDYPLPISTFGVRGNSTVPSQALMMLNNEFVLQQAARWAGQNQSIETMFWQAYERKPEQWEAQECQAFLDSGRSRADLAHVLLNSAEFLYVQ